MVQLIPMTQPEYAAYLEQAVPHYAQSLSRAGAVSKEGTLAHAEQQIRQILSNGLATENQFLFSIVDGATGDLVGSLWFGVLEEQGSPFAALYDLVILEPFRRRGYGRQALHALESEVRQVGLGQIWLSVFNYNHGARSLYSQSGYQVISESESRTFMSKTIGAHQEPT